MPAPTNSFVPFAREAIEQTIPERFARMVELHRRRLAVQDGTQGLTYGELDAASSRIAAALRGVLALASGASRPVAVFLDQGAAFITAFLGVLKAGGFPAPLDPRNPEARNRFFLEDTESPVLVTDTAHDAQARALAPGCPILHMDGDGTAHGEHPDVPSGADRIATLLYTSGSTGRPKGVLQTHRNVLHNTMRHTNEFHLGPEDRLSLFYPCGVYGGIRDIFNVLLNGASLHRYPLEVEGLGPLAGWLSSNRITIYCSVATVFRQLVRTISGQSFDDLRLIKLGGEVVFQSDFEAFRKHFGPHTLLSCGLAATEVGAVRQFFLDRDSRVDCRHVPCGFPVEDMEILILDEQGSRQPTGVAGEIAVRSAYLSPGYWRRPELTAELFLPDPEGGDRRIYRTGDLGRIEDDGQLHHLGRKDAQVKIRGNRVEIPEVEATLLESPGIREAAVILRQDPDRGNRLDAFVVPSDSGTDAAAARKFLADRLAAFMIPSRILVMERLPRLPNGKIDRQALLEHDVTGASPPPATGDPAGTARSETEQALLALWADALQTESIGVDVNFFAAGGDSLGLLLLMVAIEQQIGVRLSLSAILDTPTVSSLAARIERERLKEAGSGTCSSGLSAPQVEAGFSKVEPGAVETLADSPVPTATTDSKEASISVVPIRPTGSREPLFLVAPAGGSVLAYYRLAHLLGEDQPLYGLQVIPPRGRRGPSLDIRSLARRFVDEIRITHPRGPYRIGGWSFGGFVAYEMACRLQEIGQEVASLLVFDSDVSIAGKRPNTWTILQGIWGLFQIFYYARPFVRNSLHIRLASTLKKEETGRKAGWLTRLAWQAGLKRAPISDVIAADPRLLELRHAPPVLFMKLAAHVRAIYDYDPGSLDQEMDLFLPDLTGNREKENRRPAARVSGWSRVTGGRVRLHPVPGNHFTFFQPPHVERLAAAIRECLDVPAAAPKPSSASQWIGSAGPRTVGGLPPAG